jgi:hypothetical protein
MINIFISFFTQYFQRYVYQNTRGNQWKTTHKIIQIIRRKKYILLPKVAPPYSGLHPLHIIQVLMQLIHQQWWVKTYN